MFSVHSQAFTCSSTDPRVALKQGNKNTLTSHGLATMTGAFNSLERFWSMACAVFSVWKWQRMGSGWGATSYQAGRGSWPMALGLKWEWLKTWRAGGPRELHCVKCSKQVGGQWFQDKCAALVVWWLGVDFLCAWYCEMC